MVKKTELITELDFVTDKISSQVRTVAIGVLALAWGLLIGESSTAKAITVHIKWHLLLAGAAAIFTMFLDFLQYVVGYQSTLALYKEMKAAGVEEGQFDTKSSLYRLRGFLFNAKIWALIATVLWLLGVLGYWLVKS